MLRRLKLRTKLRLLIAIALVSTLTLGLVALLPAIDRWQDSTTTPSLTQSASRLTDFLRQIEREATQSVVLVASGDTAARNALRVIRPHTDRTARALARGEKRLVADGYPGAARAIDAVGRATRTLAPARAAIDRRTISDAATLRSFDSAAREIVRALLTLANTSTGEVSADLKALVDVTVVEIRAAQEQATLAAAIERGTLTRPLAERLVLGAADQRLARPAAIDSARQRSAVLGVATGEVEAAAGVVATMRAPALVQRLPSVTTAEWLRTTDRQLDALRTVGRILGTTATTRAAIAADAERDRVLGDAALIGGLLVLVLGGGLVLSHAITRPIRDVTRAANALVRREQEPATGLNPSSREVRPIAVRTRDEIGALATAVHDIELVMTAGAEAQRQTLRHDIGDVYVNLARRNQPLLHRQIELIDQLEASERDPERLSTLFLLDHLATRLRRNAESLLILAGVDDQRTHVDSAPLLDVVRGAVSEIASFERVDIVGLPPDVAVVGRFAVDLTHVLAELLENATIYSPPETRIFVGARRRPNGLELTIADEGVGLTVDDLDALNELLAHPPLPGFDLSRSLGLVVVARLCERIGVEVRLRSAPEVGTSAVITLPLAMLRSPDHDPAIITATDAWFGDDDTIVEPLAEPIATASAAEELPGPVDAPLPLMVLDGDLIRTPMEPLIITADVAVADREPEVVGTDFSAPVPAPPIAAERFSPVPTKGGEDLLPSGGRHARHHRRRLGRGATIAPTIPSSEAPVGSGAATPRGAPLPRRTPVAPETNETPEAVETSGPAAAAPRAPGAVFELVARYEAGRRRATTDDDKEGPE